MKYMSQIRVPSAVIMEEVGVFMKMQGVGSSLGVQHSTFSKLPSPELYMAHAYF